MNLLEKNIDEYIDGLVTQVLSSPAFNMVSLQQQEEMNNKLYNHFYQVILDTTIDNLNEEQISQLEALDPESPQMEEKISLFAAQIPGLAQVLEQKLNEEVAKIKQTGQIPQ
ncbi:MAG: hypothetical protein UU73_C0002G0054 [Candidatus Daviesbacteria bacterium GW2011_GWA1_41_61]|uniref:Uncharacterized protein n=1 Tax=Candidatus Daviesbacteria bacterium GW2011_GWA2_40_9 TaxID=1618424 RepID=A0A0G0WH84_9BACT|nr:MAG: hypothetical protein UU26_C0015G0012 [Candidatus Daviesbacteria bacterium GW2011_GWC1_40_9]KKR83690.1 MAG: hypothetical protein UU29_C0002G0003 [Candidatus Daviesbacteria bacterium GW2011_GWA2_40_9]KKR93714.1 MAG: hypothetical protein UU44_C0001G0054 [Candidatus Daviesbacteria bacterium GW2011_GWB1_41_15]KKS15180.1 MAG: hypothetical protein UU73_C0002G0054 [Candidatus Daviesbacteria bacterium GW2011_GWA1_41_61]